MVGADPGLESERREETSIRQRPELGGKVKERTIGKVGGRVGCSVSVLRDQEIRHRGIWVRWIRIGSVNSLRGFFSRAEKTADFISS